MAGNQELKERTSKALFYSFLESIVFRTVQFIIGIILARLLFPEHFGLIGMLAIFMAVAQLFINSGFGSALIQKREATMEDACSVFYFNILVGLLMAAILCAAAPWIASFYNQPILTPIIRALSLILVINSFGMIQTTLLTKNIDFKTQTKISLTASILSGIIGVSLAFLNFGVWSLVAQQVSSSVFRTALLWMFNIWRPAWVFSFQSLREMFGFGSRLFFSGLLNEIFQNIYLLAIGRLFSAADLGFFTRAKTIEEVPTLTLAGMVGRVTFPVFSAIQDDRPRLKRGMKKALVLLSFFNFPMMIGLAIIARPLVLVLLTDKWTECILYLQLLCLAGLLLPIHSINLNMLQALGRSDLFLRLEIVKKILIVINIAVTWRWGIASMILGIIVLSMISYYLNSYYTGVLIGYPISEQSRDLFSYLMMAGVMGFAVYGIGFLPFPNDWSLLLVQIPLGGIVYFGLCRMFKLAALMEVWQESRTKIKVLRGEIEGLK